MVRIMQFAKHIRTIFIALFVTILLAPAAGAATLSKRESALVAEMNRARAAHGLRPLRVDPKLVSAADAYARTLLSRNVFTHGTLGGRLASFGVVGPLVGENLAWGVGARATAVGIVRAWLASPGHRRNLLRPGFRRVGVGAVTGTYLGVAGATLVTADFAGV